MIMSIIRTIARWFRSQRGLGLVETLVAVAVLGTAAATFVASLSAGSIAVGAQDEEVTVQSLASSQLEFTKSQTFIPGTSSYPAISTPDGYSLAVTASSVPGTDENIQKITVTVSRDGEVMLTVSDYKVNR